MKKLLFIFTYLVLSSSLYAQKWLWGKQGSTESDTYAVAADNKGNAYLSGVFRDSISFENKHLASIGEAIYLVKYDSLGNLIWVTQSTGINILSNVWPISIVTDSNRNVYATGWFSDTVIFGSDTLRYVPQNGGYYNCFLVKYNASGNIIWARQASIDSLSGRGANPYSVACDKAQNVYITGVFSNVVVFGAYSLSSSYADAFLIKFDGNGTVMWAKQTKEPISGNGYATGYSVTTDKLGNVYMVGTFTDSIILGSYSLYSIYESDVFIAKFDSNGNVIWVKQANLPSFASGATPWSVAADIEGNTYIAGEFHDTITFGSVTLLSPLTMSEMFLVKYNSNGNVLWAKQSSSKDTNAAGAYSIAVDNLDNVYLSGSMYSDKIIFGKDTFFCNNPSDESIVMKLDSSGNVLCGSTVRAGGDDNNIIAVNPSGEYVYFGGDTYDTITFGNNKLNNYGTEQPFIARWQPCSGGEQGINQLSSTKPEVILFPNPNNGKFTIEVKREEIKAKSIVEIYNILGERVYTSPLLPLQRGSLAQVSLSNKPEGVYLYRVITENGDLVSSGKFVIQ